MLPAVIVFGLGLTLVVAPVTATVLAAADARHAGIASGVNNAVARVAGLLAVAVLPLIAGLTGDGFYDPDQMADGFQIAMPACAVLAAAGAVLAWLTITATCSRPSRSGAASRRSRSRPRTPVPSPARSRRRSEVRRAERRGSRQPSVDREGLAGDGGGVARGEPRDRGGDVGGRAESADGVGAAASRLAAPGSGTIACQNVPIGVKPKRRSPASLPGTRADRAEHAGDQRGLGVGLADATGAELPARGMDERHEHRQVPRRRDVGAEGACGLAALDERRERVQHRAVTVAQRFVRLGAGVDRDERVVAAERAPRGRDHPARARRPGRHAQARRRR